MTRLITTFLAVCCSFVAAYGQTETGRTGLSEGTSFMVAFPQVWAASLESPLPNALRIVVTARDTARVLIKSLDSSSGARPISHIMWVEGAHSSVYTVPLDYMHNTSESIKRLAISVTSDQLISVSTSMAWSGNGEQTTHLPIASWGTSYRSMNFYQDEYGSGGFVKRRPAQILIVAAHDNTQVTYTPSIDTEGGVDAPSTLKGQSRTITLGRGQTFLIRGKIDSTKSRDSEHDLTGTKITSTKPVAVISGHTKGAITRYPNVLPPVGLFAADAHFVRNAVHETMTPDAMAGTEFITVPILYTATRRTGGAAAEYGVDDDRGDVIRIVALEDNTVVERFDKNGRWLTQRTLQAGEATLESAHEPATIWRTSKPAHCYQFGKSWGFIVPPAMVGTTPDDRPQGHPTVEAGMPMLQSVPPINRWVDHATFRSEDGMDNFVNIVYKLADTASILVDGTTLASWPAGTRGVIAGTDYGYSRFAVTSGTHRIRTNAAGVTFGAWSYGSLDGLNQGRAYGRAVGMDLTTDCEDTITVSTSIECNVGTATFTLSGDDCTQFHSIETDAQYNVPVEVSPYHDPATRTVTVTVRQEPFSTRASTTVIVARSVSGRYVRATVTIPAFTPLGAGLDLHDFGALEPDAPDTLSIPIYNTRDEAIWVTPSIKGSHPNMDLRSEAEFMIAPNDTVFVDVIATAREEGVFRDTVVCVDRCGAERDIATLLSSYQKPVINVDFDTTSNESSDRTVYVRNRTSTGTILRGHNVRVNDGALDAFIIEFPKGTPINNVVWPVEIATGDSLPLYVRFVPNDRVGRFNQTHRFHTDDGDTIVVVLNAFVEDDPTSVDGAEPTSAYTIAVTPHPVNGDATISISGLAAGSLRLSIVDLRGSVLGAETHAVDGTTATLRGTILNSLPAGTYLLRVDQAGRSTTVSVNVSR